MTGVHQSSSDVRFSRLSLCGRAGLQSHVEPAKALITREREALASGRSVLSYGTWCFCEYEIVCLSSAEDH